MEPGTDGRESWQKSSSHHQLHASPRPSGRGSTRTSIRESPGRPSEGVTRSAKRDVNCFRLPRGHQKRSIYARDGKICSLFKNWQEAAKRSAVSGPKSSRRRGRNAARVGDKGTAHPTQSIDQRKDRDRVLLFAGPGADHPEDNG